MREVSNSEDILDSRDVIARRDELQEERADLQTEVEEQEGLLSGRIENNAPDAVDTSEADTARAALKEWDEENAEELKALNAFVDEGGSEWPHGETLIRESYFEDYARDLAEDLIGSEMRAVSWPFSCIDWKQAARELQYDYTGADFDGITYYFRS